MNRHKIIETAIFEAVKTLLFRPLCTKDISHVINVLIEQNLNGR